MSEPTAPAYTGPTITHQALEHLPYGRGETMTRCWSKWTDGSITHSDSVKTYHTDERGFTWIGSMHVNLGQERDGHPPPGLKWIDTVAAMRAIEAK